MFDCGEGSQRQLQRSIGLVALDTIFITHLHADHYLGLPGLLKTYDLNDRTEPLQIFGPPGTTKLLNSLLSIVGRVSYPLEIDELEEDEPIDYGEYEVRSYPVEHRMRAYGYVVAESTRPGRLDADKARSLGVTSGPDFGALQEGSEVTTKDGVVTPEQVVGEVRPGRRIVITGDTRPCDQTLAAAAGASLLVHDSSFMEVDAARARETGHSTASDAARIAEEAGVEMLSLIHISSRYNITDVLAEARPIFEAVNAPRDFDIIDVPLPERGGPTLVPSGARPKKPKRTAQEAPEA